MTWHNKCPTELTRENQKVRIQFLDAILPFSAETEHTLQHCAI